MNIPLIFNCPIIIHCLVNFPLLYYTNPQLCDFACCSGYCPLQESPVVILQPRSRQVVAIWQFCGWEIHCKQRENHRKIWENHYKWRFEWENHVTTLW